MNVLVTAGGTTEKIDTVRSISNMSTGKLGSLIAACFSDNPMIEKIFYVCSKAAIQPQSDKVEVVYVDSVSSLERAIKELLENTSIDIIVHSMAVSDYRVKSVTSVEILADLFVSRLDMLKRSDGQAASDVVASLLREAESVINGDGKISSDVDDMLLLMERTPKIISLFQTLSPQSTLVGFKLLDHVPLETLIDKGFQILIQNKCSFVLANDLRDITDKQHIGYLIDGKKNYMKEVILGVTGSIAAYKAAEIANVLVKGNINVNVIMTQAATQFIAPLTFQTLTKNKVYINMFEEIAYSDVRHISLAQKADCCVIAPATANMIGKIASGIADDMLSTVVMAIAHKPIIICPAMNTAMYENIITQSNIHKLQGYGYQFVEPKESRLACGDFGKGALANIEIIVTAVKNAIGEM